MDPFSMPRPHFPFGVFTPAPLLVGNTIVHPQPYHVSRFPPNSCLPRLGNQANLQPRPHCSYNPNPVVLNDEEQYIPNLPQSLLCPRSLPSPSLLRFPTLSYRAPRPAPPFLIGSLGYSEQTRGENSQQFQHSNHYGRPFPPSGIACRYRAPPPPQYTQAPSASAYSVNAPVFDTRFPSPIQEPPPPAHKVGFRNGYPIIPVGTPLRPQQPIENQGFVPDREEEEQEDYDNSEEKQVALERFSRNKTLMKVILDEKVVDCGPDLGAVKRVVSLKRQVVLLQTEVEKETERYDRTKKRCQGHMESFKKASVEYHQKMSFFSMQNYEEISAEMEQKFYLEMKGEKAQESEVKREACWCDGEDCVQAPIDFKTNWKEGIMLNNIIDWTSLTPQKCPIYEAHKFIYRNSESNLDYEDAIPNGNYSKTPPPQPEPSPPPIQQHFHLQANPFGMPVAQHAPAYQPQVALHKPPPPMTQNQFEAQQAYELQKQRHHDIIERELQAAKLRLHLKRVFEENRGDGQTTCAPPANPGHSSYNHPSSSGVGTSSDFLRATQKRTTSNRLMSGGGVVEVKKSSPLPPVAMSTTPANFANIFPTAVPRENLAGNYSGSGMYPRHEVQVEPSSFSAVLPKLESHRISSNAPTLSKLLETPPMDRNRRWISSYSKTNNPFNFSLNEGGRAAAVADYQDVEFDGSGIVEGHDQNGNVLQGGNEGEGIWTNSDDKDGNSNGNDCDEYMVPEAIEEIIISDSVDEDDQ